MQGDRVPDKVNIMVTVFLSPAEYKRLAKGRALTRDGSMSNIIRKALGMQARPLNFIGSHKYSEFQWNSIQREYEWKPQPDRRSHF